MFNCIELKRCCVVCILLMISTYAIIANEIDTDGLINDVISTYKESLHNNENADSLVFVLREKLQDKKAELSKLSVEIQNASKDLEEKGLYFGALTLLNTHINYLNTDSANLSVKKELFYSYNSLGRLNMSLRDNKRAASMYMQALNLAEQIDCDSCMASIYNNFGEFYLNQGDLEKTRSTLEKALMYNEKLKRQRDMVVNYVNLGIVYNLQKNYLKAKQSYKKSLELLDTTDVNLHSIINLNISTVYTDQRDYKKAEKYLRRGLALIGEDSQGIVSHKIELVLAKCLAHQNKIAEAKYYANEALQKSYRLNIPGKTAETRRALADVYLLMGDSVKAVKYLLSYESINDSINQEQSKEAINRLLSVYEIELLKREKHELEQSNKINQLVVSKQRIVIVGSVAMVILLLFLLFVVYRKNKSDKERNKLINQQKELKIAHEKQQFAIEREKMEQEIDFKNRQLTTSTLSQVANNEFRIKINQDLQEVKKFIKSKNGDASSKLIDKLMMDIKRTSSTYLSEEFKTYFDSVHPSFYEKISKQHPDLTANEIRLCSFLKMGLSTKEIASLTFREVRSVESARNRLRKKLCLDAGVDLITYMIDI